MIGITVDIVAREHLTTVSVPGIRRAYFSGFYDDIRAWKKIGILIAETEEGDKVKTEIALDCMDTPNHPQEIWEGVRSAIDAAMAALAAQNRRKLAAP